MMKTEDAAALGETRFGTVMGDYLRSRWVPVMRSERAESGGAPVPIRLFGRNLIVFRSPQGGLGIVDEKCPHRGASMALARNEECGLRCLYHGWAFDASGRATDVPNEPERSVVRDKVRLGSYPVREQAGAIWGYFGEDVENAVFPAFEFTQVPAAHAQVRVAVVHAHWLQCIEGVVDPTHVAVLHRAWLPLQVRELMQVIPDIEVVDRDYGFTGAVVRDIADGSSYARVKEYAMPWYALVPEVSDDVHTCVMAVPGDDDLTYLWYVMFDAENPITSKDDDVFAIAVQSSTSPPIDPDNFRSLMPFAPEGAWGQDRKAMASGHYSGLIGVVLEDIAMLESQGALQDRTVERLGAMDVLITTLRHKLLAEARAFATGRTPASTTADHGAVRAIAAVLTPGKDWRSAPVRGRDTSGVQHRTATAAPSVVAPTVPPIPVGAVVAGS